MLALAVPRLAIGADTVAMRWETCDGASLQTFDCASELESNALVISASTSDVVDSLIGVEAVVDLQSAGPVLPAWWGLDAAGCRAGQLHAVVAGIAAPGCASPWAASAVAQIQGYQSGEPRGQLNQARMLVVASVPSTSPATLAAGAVYSLLGVTLEHAHTIGGAACAGCATSVCLVLNSIRLVRIPGAAMLPDLITPAAGNAAWATWQASDELACQSVPARNRTWGSIKSLYR